MNYIVLDLEWTNGYSKALKKSINEIIEIGALRIDENLNICDTYKQLVKPFFTGNLSWRVKSLTHITNEEIAQDGIDLSEALADFADWVGEDEAVFLTWSNTDIYVLAEAYDCNESKVSIDFIKKYADAQKYCQLFIKDIEQGNQISLLNAANKLQIENDENSLHRALADCMLTAKCFIKCFDKEKFNQYVHTCNKRFFERLMFKSYLINNLDAAGISLDDYQNLCPECCLIMKQVKKWENVNNAFRAIFQCKSCKNRFYVTCRFKQQYDKIDVKQKISPAKKPKIIEKNENKK